MMSKTEDFDVLGIESECLIHALRLHVIEMVGFRIWNMFPTLLAIRPAFEEHLFENIHFPSVLLDLFGSALGNSRNRFRNFLFLLLFLGDRPVIHKATFHFVILRRHRRNLSESEC